MAGIQAEAGQRFYYSVRHGQKKKDGKGLKIDYLAHIDELIVQRREKKKGRAKRIF